MIAVVLRTVSQTVMVNKLRRPFRLPRLLPQTDQMVSIGCSLDVLINQCCISTGTPASVFVGNLSFDLDEDMMMKFFVKNGCQPTSVRIIMGADGRPKGLVVHRTVAGRVIDTTIW